MSVACETAHELLCARLDEELPAEMTPALDEHLAQCADCRALADALSSQSQELRRAFAGERRAADNVAERAIEQLLAGEAPVRARARGWLVPLLAAAAGFLLAVAVFRPWQQPQRPPPQAGQPPASIAHLALATGLVERLEGSSWQALATGAALRAGDRLRTAAEVRCELLVEDGSLVRLNAGTELCLQGPRALQLLGGQVWSQVEPAADTFRVRLPDASVEALGTRFDVSLLDDQAVVIVEEGATRVRTLAGEALVQAGQRLQIDAGVAGDPHQLGQVFQATQWVHEILVLKGRDNPELAERLNDVLAQLGRQKVHYLLEEEIRALGDHCVLPLVRYLQATYDLVGNDREVRQRAARIVADIAAPWSIPLLIELLEDPDLKVCAQAARALERLTDRSLGLTSEQWLQATSEQAKEVQLRWRSWWQENKYRFPGAWPLEH